MNPFDLSDKDAYDWAVKKVASDLLFEQKEEYARQFPSDELKHIYATLDEKIIIVLATNGIPITREELHKMFPSWFVKRSSPKWNGDSNNPETEHYPSGPQPL